jgi:hypothetical protein
VPPTSPRLPRRRERHAHSQQRRDDRSGVCRIVGEHLPPRRRQRQQLVAHTSRIRRAKAPLCAYEIAAWLKHLVNETEAKSVVAEVALRLATAYKASDAKTRNRIETGALEHALESPRVRPFFSLWASDPVLKDAYGPALEWGLSHTEEAG